MRFSKSPILAYLRVFLVALLGSWALLELELLGWLPLNLPVFTGLSLLGLVLLVIQPRWGLWTFVSFLALENLIISPEQLPASLRPFQWVGALTLGALVLRIGMENLLPKIKSRYWQESFTTKAQDFLKQRGLARWLDGAIVLLLALAFVSAALSPIASIKLAIVTASFGALYFLARFFLRTSTDRIEALIFFLTGSIVPILFGLYQAVAFRLGWQHWEVFAHRVNSTFTEPDWLGMYGVVLMAVVLFLQQTVLENPTLKNICWGNWSFASIFRWLLSGYLLLVLAVLFLTVARSAWLGAAMVLIVYFGILIVKAFKAESLDPPNPLYKKKSQSLSKSRKFGLRRVIREGLILGALGVITLGGVIGLGLSSFNFLDRATSSVSGQQLITISCAPDAPEFERITSLKELPEKDCRHINLEEKKVEGQQGRDVREIYRPDPNVDIRKNIYATIWNKIKERPWLGYGVGSTGSILGQDAHGSDLNASNLFLEAWFSLGVGGVIVMVGIWVLATILPLRLIFTKSKKSRQPESLLLLLVAVALLVPNLFNAGLLLGILWVFWAWLGSFIGEN